MGRHAPPPRWPRARARLLAAAATALGIVAIVAVAVGSAFSVPTPDQVTAGPTEPHERTTGIRGPHRSIVPPLVLPTISPSGTFDPGKSPGDITASADVLGRQVETRACRCAPRRPPVPASTTPPPAPADDTWSSGPDDDVEPTEQDEPAGEQPTDDTDPGTGGSTAPETSTEPEPGTGTDPVQEPIDDVLEGTTP